MSSQNFRHRFVCRISIRLLKKVTWIDGTTFLPIVRAANHILVYETGKFSDFESFVRYDVA
jgi:hypothetical protein